LKQETIFGLKGKSWIKPMAAMVPCEDIHDSKLLCGILMMTMIKKGIAGVIILITLLAVVPVQAFTSDSLTIGIMPEGDARIEFQYTLSFLEKMGVALNIADPGSELKKALESNFHLPVAVEEVSDSSARFKVSRFSQKKETNGSIRMETPAMSFTMAEKILEKYWFASLVTPDFSPAVTTITYPDGYAESFRDQIDIPKTSHILTS
jgi:hypothetical protein